MFKYTILSPLVLLAACGGGSETVPIIGDTIEPGVLVPERPLLPGETIEPGIPVSMLPTVRATYDTVVLTNQRARDTQRVCFSQYVELNNFVVAQNNDAVQSASQSLDGIDVHWVFPNSSVDTNGVVDNNSTGVVFTGDADTGVCTASVYEGFGLNNSRTDVIQRVYNTDVTCFDQLPGTEIQRYPLYQVGDNSYGLYAVDVSVTTSTASETQRYVYETRYDGLKYFVSCPTSTTLDSTPIDVIVNEPTFRNINWRVAADNAVRMLDGVALLDINNQISTRLVPTDSDIQSIATGITGGINIVTHEGVINKRCDGNRSKVDTTITQTRLQDITDYSEYMFDQVNCSEYNGPLIIERTVNTPSSSPTPSTNTDVYRYTSEQITGTISYSECTDLCSPSKALIYPDTSVGAIGYISLVDVDGMCATDWTINNNVQYPVDGQQDSTLADVKKRFDDSLTLCSGVTITRRGLSATSAITNQTRGDAQLVLTDGSATLTVIIDGGNDQVIVTNGNITINATYKF